MKKLMFLMFALFAVSAFAAITQITTIQDRSIPVYDTPDNKTSPTTTMTKGQKLISVYEQNDWLKVANPDNGNIGWVKKNDWKAAAKNVISIEQVGNGYSITSQNSDGSMNSSYRVIQTSGDKTNSEEMNTFFNDLQKQQQNMQQHFEKIRQDMMKNMEVIDERMKKLWKENTPAVIETPKNQKDKKQNDNSKK